METLYRLEVNFIIFGFQGVLHLSSIATVLTFNCWFTSRHFCIVLQWTKKWNFLGQKWWVFKNGKSRHFCFRPAMNLSDVIRVATKNGSIVFFCFNVNWKQTDIYNLHVDPKSDLETLELNTLNPDRLIWISTVETYDFLNSLIWYTLIGRI